MSTQGAGQELAPLISGAAESWPTFRGSTENEHIEVGRMLVESVAGHFWQLGAIAASYADKFGGTDELGKWASAVGVSKRRAQEWAFTYREWSKPGRERSRILSFGHHTIAARAGDPTKWIATAETENLSQRRLEARILTNKAITNNEFPPTDAAVEVDNGQAYMTREPNVGPMPEPERGFPLVDKPPLGLSANDWIVIYGLVDQYVEACRANPELDEYEALHEYREGLRERVTEHLIYARRHLIAARKRKQDLGTAAPS